MALTLTQLRARARERADMTGSAFVTDGADSVDSWINTGLDKAYELLLDTLGEENFAKSQSVSIASGANTVSLPTDFLRLLGIDVVYQGDTVSLHRFNFAERNVYLAAANSGVMPRYRLVGGNVLLYPAASAALTGTIWYVPARTQLVSNTDSCNLTVGYEEYAILYAAIQMLAKEESDTSGLERLLAAEQSRIVAKEELDETEPEKPIDTDRSNVYPAYRGRYGVL